MGSLGEKHDPLMDSEAGLFFFMLHRLFWRNRFYFCTSFYKISGSARALFENHLKNFKCRILRPRHGNDRRIAHANLLALPFSNLPFGSYIAVF
jgi:hypothetical protein